MVKYHGPNMIFCGLKYSSLDLNHSHYTRFRNRISEDIAKNLSTKIIHITEEYGFSDSNLWTRLNSSRGKYLLSFRHFNDEKLIQKSEKILKYLIKKGSFKAKNLKDKINFKKIGKDLKSYFFNET